MVNENMNQDIISVITDIFRQLEDEIPELSVRMTTHMLHKLIENSSAEIKKETEAHAAGRKTVEVFCEMRKAIHALAAAYADSDAGRMCKCISNGMQGADVDAMRAFAEKDNGENLIPIFLTVYENVRAEFLALTNDDDFLMVLGPRGKDRLIQLSAVMQYVIDDGKLFMANNYHGNIPTILSS